MPASTSCLAFIALTCTAPFLAAADQPAKMLLFTRSQGFEHSVIKANPDGSPNLVEKTLATLGTANNFTVLHTKDGSYFTAEKLKPFDVIAFYTTGDLTKPAKDGSNPMPAEGKQALFDAIQGGKGFIAFHSASDTFHTSGDRYKTDEKPDPYISCLGGEFIIHGAQQKAKIVCADSGFPELGPAREGFTMHEEWYSLKDFAPELHAILVLDTQGMTGAPYQRSPYPMTWIRPFGKGRVFYTAMGHREDVWTNPVFQQVIVAGIKAVLGRTEPNMKPNLEQVAPKAGDIPPKK